jgi:hypothetical protein
MSDEEFMFVSGRPIGTCEYMNLAIIELIVGR